MGDENDAHTEGTHFSILGVHLSKVGKATGEHFNGNRITVLVFEVGCLISGSLNQISAVGWHAGDNTANVGGQCKNIVDRGGLHKLVRHFALGDHHRNILAFQTDRGDATLVDRFKSVFCKEKTELVRLKEAKSYYQKS